MDEVEINRKIVIKCAEFFCVNNSNFKFVCSLCTELSENREWWDFNKYFKHLRDLHTRLQNHKTDTECEFLPTEEDLVQRFSDGDVEYENLLIELVSMENINLELMDNKRLATIEYEKNEDYLQQESEGNSYHDFSVSESDLANVEGQRNSDIEYVCDTSYVTDINSKSSESIENNSSDTSNKECRRNEPYSCNVLATRVKKRFQCSQCEKTYCNEQNLTRHMNSRFRKTVYLSILWQIVSRKRFA